MMKPLQHSPMTESPEIAAPLKFTPDEYLRLASTLAGSALLRSIRMVHCSATLEVKDRKESSAAEGVDIRYSAVFLHEGDLLDVTTYFTFVGLSPKDETGGTVVDVQAAFALRYALTQDTPREQVHVEAFARVNGLFNAWPYWREFLQSTLTRFDIPPFPLPLLPATRAAKLALLSRESDSSSGKALQQPSVSQ